ncbi:hypothetical protein V8B97DRAFT_2024025 [Scleroderma yunnanense]
MVMVKKKEILAGNYDIDNYSSTPPLEFPSPDKDQDGAEATFSDSPCWQLKKSHHSSHHQTMDEKVDVNDNENGGECLQCLKHGGLPREAIKKALALATALVNEYSKDIGTIMNAAGIYTKPPQAESIWNMHQAYVYEEEYAELWVEICKYLCECISRSKDTSLKIMVSQVIACRDAFTQSAQTWCNVEDIHVFGCVIYMGSNEAACQVQGIFAGSNLCMELCSK